MKPSLITPARQPAGVRIGIGQLLFMGVCSVAPNTPGPFRVTSTAASYTGRVMCPPLSPAFGLLVVIAGRVMADIPRRTPATCEVGLSSATSPCYTALSRVVRAVDASRACVKVC